MDFDLTSSSDGDVLVVVFSGRVGDDNAAAMAARYLEVVRATRPKKVLADVRPLQGHVSSGALYYLVRSLPRPIPEGVKTAYLATVEGGEDAHYLESTAHNAGVELKAFIDRDAALAWLRQP